MKQTAQTVPPILRVSAVIVAAIRQIDFLREALRWILPCPAVQAPTEGPRRQNRGAGSVTPRPAPQ
jgi:hypothetical protein